MRKTKIICTLGPSTDKDGVLEELIKEGMNVARFNFSHGLHDEQKGRIDKLKENVDTSIVDVSDLSGIQFKLSAKVDIIDPADGSIIYKKGQEVNTYNVDKKGNLKIEKLPMGTYELQEVKTLDGLVLNETKYEVKFTQKDTTTKVYTETREVVNDTTLVEISKTTITGDKELEGAELSVIDENGKVI